MPSEILGKVVRLYLLPLTGEDELSSPETEFMVPTKAPLHLAVALDGAGWHPAAWREPDAQPERLLTAGYWTGLARQAERGLLDFLTIEDGLDLQADDHFHGDSRTNRVRAGWTRC